MGKNCTGPAAGPAPAPGNGGTHERGNDFLTAIWPAGNHPVVDCALQPRHCFGVPLVVAAARVAWGPRARLQGTRRLYASGRGRAPAPGAGPDHAAVDRGGLRRPSVAV